jgi:hypothetical protein
MALGGLVAMFIHETKSNSRHATSVFGVIALLLLKSFGGILTMHIYVQPRAPVPRGWRIFGFPRRKKKSTERHLALRALYDELSH